MSTRDLAFATLERLINALLDMDPYAKQQLSLLHGRIIGIHLRGLELNLFFIPGQTGHLQVQSRIEGAPDALLSGSPLDLMRTGDKQQGARQLFAGRVGISGDSRLAQRFGGILAGLDIDWEEQLSHLTGDIIAHQLGNGVRGFLRYSKNTAHRLEQDIGEYLAEESGLLAHPLEIEEFIQAVDTLRDDTERLAARIKRLQDKLENRNQ